MDLTNEQKAQVSAWISEGLGLSDVQKRLAEEFGLNMTFMEVRFLVDDLDLELKDKSGPRPDADLSRAPAPAPAAAPGDDEPLPFPGAEDDMPGGGQVSVTLDKIQRPGAVLSGSVTFSDGKTMDWQLDQTGRLGLIPRSDTGDYRPSEGDLTEFQIALQQELQRSGRLP
ncbi:hypothetical protein H5P28_18945 [Ruficoccus amylovorans]|uniref:Uncharacterized protein n=1 Tax=Ruficoccus amylovorans TaxID=1804625 RepID=A0A842HJQ1_9BACT|nr:hypothetical protein [Ruficoccus amylovorans]MBC2596350.1 hypothetical protein [Ruficoccus amylovorans]